MGSVDDVIFFHAEAQEQKPIRLYRHEISIGLAGNNVRSPWSDDYVQTVMNDFDLSIRSRGFFCEHHYSVTTPDLRWDKGIYVLDYYYHINHHLAVGGFLQGLHVNEALGYIKNHYNDYGYDGQEDAHICDIDGWSFFLMPTVKWSWVNRRWCRFYSKVSLGLHYQRLHLDSDSIPKDVIDKYRQNHISAAYVLTPFGWEIGRKHFRWFMEFGYSRTLRFKMGLIYRFHEFNKK